MINIGNAWVNENYEKFEQQRGTNFKLRCDRCDSDALLIPKMSNDGSHQFEGISMFCTHCGVSNVLICNQNRE